MSERGMAPQDTRGLPPTPEWPHPNISSLYSSIISPREASGDYLRLNIIIW